MKDQNMIERSVFREGMSRLGAAVTLITTDGIAGRQGFTAAAVGRVTDAPPTLLVCMNRSVSSHAAFQSNGVLGVSVLAGSHEPLSGRFANSALEMDQRFDGATWTTIDDGAPLLAGAAVGFDCRISSMTDVGTHTVLFCEIRHILLGEDVPDALLWVGRAYHRLPLRPVQVGG